jgi:hypothetical protein
MVRRLKLHEEFCAILDSKNVYFQPPQSLRMSYPCIRYSPSTPDQTYANNKFYRGMKRYEGVIIDSDPESVIPSKLQERFGLFSLGEPYVADNLNHYQFTLYY